MQTESLLMAVLLGHGPADEVAICRMILGFLCAMPAVLLLIAGIGALTAPRRSRYRTRASRYNSGRVTARMIGRRY